MGLDVNLPKMDFTYKEVIARFISDPTTWTLNDPACRSLIQTLLSIHSDLRYANDLNIFTILKSVYDCKNPFDHTLPLVLDSSDLIFMREVWGNFNPEKYPYINRRIEARPYPNKMGTEDNSLRECERSRYDNIEP